jgi:hypothetical protein
MVVILLGKTELWLKLAKSWPIVAIPPALVWWRRHEGQQMSLEMTKPEVLNERFWLNGCAENDKTRECSSEISH